MTQPSQERQISNMKQDVFEHHKGIRDKERGSQPWLHIIVNSPRTCLSITSRNFGQLVWIEAWLSIFF